MPKKVEEEIVESVEGRVEGMTFDEEEQRIRVAAREKALAEHGDKVIGSTKMSAVTGNILRNRARNSAVRQRTYTSGAELAGQIFLHRTADAQHLIVGEISDAESAGTQHPADNKPVLQSCTCRQLIGLVGGNAARCPAVGAGRSRIVICIKTAQT